MSVYTVSCSNSFLAIGFFFQKNILKMLRPRQLASWLGTLFLICGEVRGLGDAVVYAVNCGGEAHTDMLGVKYERDDNRHGTPSDYGKQLMIGRVSQQDQILYQVNNDFNSRVINVL